MKHGFRRRQTTDRRAIEAFYVALRSKTHDAVHAYELNHHGRKILYVSPWLSGELRRQAEKVAPGTTTPSALLGIPFVVNMSLPHWVKKPTPRDLKRSRHRKVKPVARATEPRHDHMVDALRYRLGPFSW